MHLGSANKFRVWMANGENENIGSANIKILKTKIDRTEEKENKIKQFLRIQILTPH